ncbi:MAG TPA: PKD domain-containing protein, partial [Candidatus Gracilibacteria bacterium]
AIENPIRISGNNVNDFGNGVVVPLETARGQGVQITLETDGKAEVDFGDGTKVFHDTVGGTIKTLPENKRYGQKGVYNLKARVETSEGVIQNFQKQIIVGGATADIIVGGANVRVGDKVTFNGVRSSASAGTITDYQWNCEGAAGCFSTLETEDIEVVFTEPGDYKVSLTVESSIGARDTKTVDLKVKANRPSAVIEFESTGNDRKPAEYRFDGGKSTDTEGNTKGLLYLWDFDGEKVETYDAVTIYEFPSSGEKTVKLKVEQSDGPRKLESDPTADTMAQKTFTIETIVGCEILLNNESILGIANPMIVRGDRTRFEVQSAQASNFEWTFTGVDGGTSTQIDRVAYFTYEDAADNINVSLRAFDDITDDEQDCGFTARVINKGKPTAIIDVKLGTETIYKDQVTITRGDALTLASLSVDDSGTNDNIRETWRVNGRLVRDTDEINRFFAKTGDYTVQLIAANKDDANIRDTDEFTVTVVNRKPEITSVTSSQDSRLGLQSVRVDATALDEDGTIELYTFQVINADTGGVELGQTRKENFAYFNLTQFPGRFRYRFRVIATDNDGGTAESTSDMEEATGIEIDNFPPELSLYVTPSNAGTLDTIFTFIGQGTDEDGDALTYQWTFPDGPWYEETRNFRFTDVGTYIVGLTVSDGLEEATADLDIIVVESAEELDPVENTAPTAEIHAVLPSTIVPVYSPVYLYSRGNDVDGDVLTYEWDFGDGNRTQVQHSIHTYVNEGSYTVTLTASDGLETVTDSETIQVVSKEEGQNLDPEVLAFLRNKYENDGEPLTEAEQAELLAALENKVEIGTYRNYDELTRQEQEDIENLEYVGSYTNFKNLNADEQDRLKNILNSEVGSYTDFDNLTPDEQKNLQNALELGTYKQFDQMPQDERDAITNLVATGDYKNFDDLNETEKRALENVLRKGTYKYLTEMNQQEIAELVNDIEGGSYGEMTPQEIQRLKNKLETGSYGQLTEAEWKILQNKALFNDRQGIDLEALKNKGYANPVGQLDLSKLRNAGYVNDSGALDLAALRNGGLITETGEIDLASLRNRGFVDADGNLDLEELRNRGFVNDRNQLDLQAMRNPVLLGTGSQALPNGPVNVEDNAYIYTQLKSKVDERIAQCRKNIALANAPEERQRLQKICDDLETQERRTIDTLSAIDILRLEAMIEEDPFIKRQLDERIQKIETELDNPGDFEFVSIGGNPSTTFFLYGVAPDDYPRALSFVWDLGDGRKAYGQNVSVQYPKAGIYRVSFTVSDGTLEVSDFLRIHVLRDGVKLKSVENTHPNDL